MKYHIPPGKEKYDISASYDISLFNACLYIFQCPGGLYTRYISYTSKLDLIGDRFAGFSLFWVEILFTKN